MSRVTFDDLIGSRTSETFFAEYFDRSCLIVRGAVGACEDLLDRRAASDLLNTTCLWTPKTLRIVVDGEFVRAGDFCRPSIGRETDSVMRPDPEKVRALVERGATVVMHAMDTASPGIAGVASELADACQAAVGANLYLSRAGQGGLRPHYDCHHVFVIQLSGKKRWVLYETRVDAPLDNREERNYNSIPGLAERVRGPAVVEETLGAGDVLYIPRGQYHEAVAESEVAMHVAFDVSVPTGLAYLDAVVSVALEDDLLRQDVPRRVEGDAEGLGAHLQSLAARIAAIARRPDLLADFARRRARLDYPGWTRSVRGSVELPDDDAGKE